MDDKENNVWPINRKALEKCLPSMIAASKRWTQPMYYILKDDKPVPASLLEWAEWFEKFDRKIKKDAFMVNGEEIEISTVFVGIGVARPSMLYETMIFGGKFDLHEIRSASKADALDAHQEAVKLALSGESFWRRVLSWVWNKK